MTYRILIPLVTLFWLTGCGSSSKPTPPEVAETETTTSSSSTERPIDEPYTHEDIGGTGIGDDYSFGGSFGETAASYSSASFSSTAASSFSSVSFSSSPSAALITEADGDVISVPSDPGTDFITVTEPDFIKPEPVQAGTLTAGDYDDHLNPWLYQQYVSDFLQYHDREGSDLPFVDLNQKITIKVLDENGVPAAGSMVNIVADGIPLMSGKTSVRGEWFVYPQYDDLPAQFEVEIAYDGDAEPLNQTVQLEDLDELRVVTVNLPITTVTTNNVDIALLLDSTGSMGDELNYLQAEFDSIVLNLKDANPHLNMQFSLILYRDTGDYYVVRKFGFTDDIDTFSEALNQQSAAGGGNYPEAMDQAFEALNSLPWRDDSIKITLMSADAPPHSNKYVATWEQIKALRSKLIHVVPIAASGVDENAEFLMRAMSLITQSRFLFLTDDSGVGNSHAEPTVDCYLVTRLDSLVRRVLHELITGERIEPEEADIIRSQGNYNQGVCEPPAVTESIEPIIED